MWIKETTEYITDIGKRAQKCTSSEEATKLMEQLEQYIQPKQKEQEERMKRLQTAAVMLHGECMHPPPPPPPPTPLDARSPTCLLLV